MNQRTPYWVLLPCVFASVLVLAAPSQAQDRAVMPGLFQNIEDIEVQDDIMVTIFEGSVDSVRCLTQNIMLAYEARVESLNKAIDIDFTPAFASSLTKETAAIDAKIFKQRLRMALHRLSEKPACPPPEPLKKTEKSLKKTEKKVTKSRPPSDTGGLSPGASQAIGTGIEIGIGVGLGGLGRERP